LLLSDINKMKNIIFVFIAIIIFNSITYDPFNG